MHDYLADRLPEGDARALEERLIREPALVAELELALRMQAGLGRLARRGRLAPLLSRTTRTRALGVGAALAAGLAGIALAFWVLRGSPPPLLTTAPPSGAAGSISAHFTFRAMRGATPPVILARPQSGLVEFAVAPSGAQPGVQFRVSLVSTEGGARTELGTLVLRADERGLVAAYATAERLAQGRYELDVAPAARDVPPERYAFELAPAPH
jgi:hypothetical protein